MRDEDVFVCLVPHICIALEAIHQRLTCSKVLQSTRPGDVNDDLMELLIMIRACKDASARRIVSINKKTGRNHRAEAF